MTVTVSPAQACPPSKSPSSDAQLGEATRVIVQEQAKGVNRAPASPYRAYTAGKAYQSYVDSIGQTTDAIESSTGDSTE